MARVMPSYSTMLRVCRKELTPEKTVDQNYEEAVPMEEPVEMTVPEQAELCLFEENVMLYQKSATTKI